MKLCLFNVVLTVRLEWLEKTTVLMFVYLMESTSFSVTLCCMYINVPFLNSMINIYYCRCMKGHLLI